MIMRGMAEMIADEHPDEWDVHFIKEAKVDKRECTCIQVRRTKYRKIYSFFRIRIFVDNELQIPVRFTSHSFDP